MPCGRAIEKVTQGKELQMKGHTVNIHAQYAQGFKVSASHGLIG